MDKDTCGWCAKCSWSDFAIEFICIDNPNRKIIQLDDVKCKQFKLTNRLTGGLTNGG